MATVIKAGRIIPSGTAVQHSEFNLQDMSQHAAQYLDEVKLKAAQLVKQAQQQAVAVQREAAERGKQAAADAARQAAQQEAARQWQTLAPALQQAIRETSQLRANWVQHWEEHLIQLVVGVAQRVIRTELTLQPAISRQWILEALELASGSTAITLQLNPDDYAALDGQLEDIRQQFSQLAEARIVPVPEITPGGCRVVTDHGSIDQQIESQLQRIADELTS